MHEYDEMISPTLHHVSNTNPHGYLPTYLSTYLPTWEDDKTDLRPFDIDQLYFTLSTIRIRLGGILWCVYVCTYVLWTDSRQKHHHHHTYLPTYL